MQASTRSRNKPMRQGRNQRIQVAKRGQAGWAGISRLGRQAVSQRVTAPRRFFSLNAGLSA
jgi:hypothetical protein